MPVNPSPALEQWFGDSKIVDDDGIRKAIAHAISQGHDGLIVESPDDGDGNGMFWPTNYVVFSLDQIREVDVPIALAMNEEAAEAESENSYLKYHP